MDYGQTISVGETIEMLNPAIGGLRKYEVQTRRNVDRVTHMLVIRRLQQQDAGQYKCTVRIASVANNQWPTKIGTITVQGRFVCLCEQKACMSLCTEGLYVVVFGFLQKAYMHVIVLVVN